MVFVRTDGIIWNIKRAYEKKEEMEKNCLEKIHQNAQKLYVWLLKSLLLFESKWKISMRKYFDKSYDYRSNEMFEFRIRNSGICSWSIPTEQGRAHTLSKFSDIPFNCHTSNWNNQKLSSFSNCLNSLMNIFCEL